MCLGCAYRAIHRRGNVMRGVVGEVVGLCEECTMITMWRVREGKLVCERYVVFIVMSRRHRDWKGENQRDKGGQRGGERRRRQG